MKENRNSHKHSHTTITLLFISLESQISMERESSNLCLSLNYHLFLGEDDLLQGAGLFNVPEIDPRWIAVDPDEFGIPSAYNA